METQGARAMKIKVRQSPRQSTKLSELIKIWKFESAPHQLRRGHTVAQRPQWLVLIPASIHGPDIDELIRAQASLDNFCSYRTKTGDIVYTGSWSRENDRPLRAAARGAFEPYASTSGHSEFCAGN